MASDQERAAPPADRTELAAECKRLLKAIPAGALRPTIDRLVEPIIAAIEALARSTDAPSEGSWIAADDVRRAARAIDVALNGEAGAALAPALIDIEAQMTGLAATLGRPIIDALAAPVGAVWAMSEAEYDRMVNGLMAQLGEISEALGISEEEQSCANGNDAILAAIEDLKQPAASTSAQGEWKAWREEAVAKIRQQEDVHEYPTAAMIVGASDLIALIDAATQAPAVPAAETTNWKSFAEGLLAMIGQISYHLGISEEEQATANGAEEIIARMDELMAAARSPTAVPTAGVTVRVKLDPESGEYLSVPPAAKCACGEKLATECDELWGPDCDMGNNAKHARRASAVPATDARAEPTPQRIPDHLTGLDAIQLDRLAERIVLEVAEIPDRNSPEDWPEAMLVTCDELRGIVLSALSDACGTSVATTAPAEAPSEALIDAAFAIRYPESANCILHTPEAKRFMEPAHIQAMNGRAIFGQGYRAAITQAASTGTGGKS